MHIENRGLLEEVILKKLEESLKETTDNSNEALELALRAIDRQIELEKIENNLLIEKNRLEVNERIETNKVEMNKVLERTKLEHAKEIEEMKIEFNKEMEDKKIKKDTLIKMVEIASNESVERDKMKHNTKVENEKNNTNKEIEDKKIKKDTLIKIVEIGALLIAAPLIDSKAKMAFAKMICDFERDGIFTTAAGRGLTSLFKFK